MKKQFRYRLGQEFRANLKDEDGRSWGRAKRAKLVRMVLTNWDYRDRHYIRDKKSWKRKRDKQYHVDGRPQKHVIVIPDGRCRTWLLSQYLEKHDIPYRILPRREKRVSVYWQTEERKLWYNVPVYHHVFQDGKLVTSHQIGYRHVYHYVPLATPIRKEREYRTTVEYEVAWWSNKDIDIEKILAAYPLQLRKL